LGAIFAGKRKGETQNVSTDGKLFAGGKEREKGRPAHSRVNNES